MCTLLRMNELVAQLSPLAKRFVRRTGILAQQSGDDVWSRDLSTAIYIGLGDQFDDDRRRVCDVNV
jgi:hypothetical protein